MLKKSLYKELKRIPRDSEDSSIVASAWGATVDPYLPEIPDVESGNEQCRELYFSITAERLLFRKKLLGLPVDENLVANEHITTAHPFGVANPTFSELAAPSVRLAAAFVPLTPDENDVTLRPAMARLYCVAGLPERYALPLTDGLKETGIRNYNWFVAGVKEDVLKMGISGRSWLLAANLLMRVVEQNDMATARNLINNFIVTGNVEDGAISHVTIGRKPELANIKEFRNLKWIIPMKNANEMTTVPGRRIEKPATLDEAYKLIETMQSKATHSFFRFLKSFDLVGMRQQLEIGADIFAEDPETSLLPIEFITTAIDLAMMSNNGTMQYPIIARPIRMPERLVNDLGMMDFLPKAKSIAEWLKCQGADCAKTVYILAKQRLFEAIAELAKVYPIETRDGAGCTAVDVALNNKDWETARYLYERFGIKCDTTASRNKRMKDVIDKLVNEFRYADAELTKEDVEFIRQAMEVGLTPESRLLFVSHWPEDAACPRKVKSLFALAISSNNEPLVRLCLEKGADPNARLQTHEMPLDGVDGSHCGLCVIEDCTPMEMALKLSDCDSCDRMISLLKESGGLETPVVLAMQNKLKIAKILQDGIKRHEMYLDALKKLCTDKDDVQNHELIIECLKRGESMEEQVCAEECEYDGHLAVIKSSLWGMSIYFGWYDIAKECLRIGGNSNDVMRYHVSDYFDGQLITWIVKPPIDVVKGNDYADGRIKSQLLELLNAKG